MDVNGAKIGGVVFLSGKFQAEGEVRLHNADIGGDLACDGASFKNANGVALNANGARIGGAVFLRNAFRAEGETRLYGAELSGDLACDGGSFKNAGGTALNAEVATIGGGVFLRNELGADVAIHDISWTALRRSITVTVCSTPN